MSENNGSMAVVQSKRSFSCIYQGYMLLSEQTKECYTFTKVAKLAVILKGNILLFIFLHYQAIVKCVNS